MKCFLISDHIYKKCIDNNLDYFRVMSEAITLFKTGVIPSLTQAAETVCNNDISVGIKDKTTK